VLRLIAAGALVAMLFVGRTGGHELPSPPRALEPAPQASAVPLRVVRSGGSVVVLVALTLEGQGPYDFVLDTGASRSVVDRQLAEELGLERMRAVPQVTGVSGPAEASIVRVREWSAGDVTFPGMALAAIDLQFSDSAVVQQLVGRRLYGLLGSDLLSVFRTVVIDYEQELLTLGGR
jgi:predicted aspartyl protease